MAQSDVGCYLAGRLCEPNVEYWRSSTSQQELLSKPPHHAVFIDGQEQVEAYFLQSRPMSDAYRRYLPNFSRLDWLQKKDGYDFLILPVPVVPANPDFAEQVQAATQAAGPVWLADTDVQHCRGMFRAEDGYFLQLRSLPLEAAHRSSRWRSHKQEYVEVRYAPRSARRSLHARKNLAKRDAVSVAELCQLIDALAVEARSFGWLTGYSPTSWRRAGVQTLVGSLNAVLAVHQTICGRWAYRENQQYLRFVRHARATQQATLRKFRDQGFRAWLQRELRSRAVRHAIARAGMTDVGHCPKWKPSCLRLPFDEAQTAEKSRGKTTSGRRTPRR
jgi:hypothetical protein